MQAPAAVVMQVLCSGATEHCAAVQPPSIAQQSVESIARAASVAPQTAPESTLTDSVHGLAAVTVMSSLLGQAWDKSQRRCCLCRTFTNQSPHIVCSLDTAGSEGEPR